MKIVQMPPVPQSTPEKTRHFRRVNLENIMSSDIPQIDYILDRLIPRSFTTLLSGHGGTGKTIFALTIAAHVAAGVPWCGFQVKCGRVLFVSLEDPGELIKKRLRFIIEEYGLPFEMVNKNLDIRDASHTAGALAVEVVERGVRHLQMSELWAELVDDSEGCDFIIIDNASEASNGNENDRNQVKEFMSELTRLARKRQAGILLLAHVDKTAARYNGLGNTYSGSTAWHNSARSRLALTAKGNDGLVELVQEKMNLAAKVKDKILLSWDGDVLKPLLLDEAVGVELDTEVVFAALKKTICAGITIPVASTGISTAHEALKKLLPGHLTGKKGRRRLYDALNDLLMMGKIKETEFDAPGRHKRLKYDLPHQQVSHEAPSTSPIPPCARTRATGASGIAALADCANNTELAQPAHWRQDEIDF